MAPIIHFTHNCHGITPQIFKSFLMNGYPDCPGISKAALFFFPLFSNCKKQIDFMFLPKSTHANVHLTCSAACDEQ